MSAAADYNRTLLDAGVGKELGGDQNAPLRIGLNVGGVGVDKAGNLTGLRRGKLFQLVRVLFPFLHGEDRKAFVYVSGDHKSFAQLIPMLGRNKQTVLRIQIVREFTHQHGFLLLSSGILHYFPPHSTTL